jgi:hypothetical protein
VRFTICVEETTEEAADPVVEAGSSLVMIENTARITMQPLPRYGKARFIDLIWLLGMDIGINPQPR